MLSSKTLQIFTVALMAVITTVGCWSPDRSGSDSSEAANFQITTGKFIKAIHLDSSKNKNTFLPNAEMKHKMWKHNYLTQFTFQVCLTEKGSEKNVYKKSFKITNSEGEQIAYSTTQRNGCMVWNEPVYYNVLAPSKYLKMKRNIVGGGVYNGSTSFHIVINPWAQQRGKKDSAFIPEFDGNLLAETTYEILKDPETIKAALVGKYDIQDLDGQLFLEDFKYSLDKIEGSKVSSEFYLRIEKGQVFAKTRDADGDYHRMNLESGAFSIAVKVMQGSRTTNNELLPLSLYHPNFSGQDGKAKKSIAAVNPIFYTGESNGTKPFPFHNYSDGTNLKGSIPLAIENWKRQKQVRILLELDGHQYPFNNFLKPLKAVYRGGSFESGKAELMQPKEHGLFARSGIFTGKTEFDRYMSPSENLANPNNLPVFHEYTIGAVKLNFLSQANGESVSNRGIKYLGKVCLTQRNGQVRPQGQKFKIRIYSETTGADINFKSRQRAEGNKDQNKAYKTQAERLSTEDGGCISWVDEIWFKHYKQETYFIYRAEIQEVGSDQVTEVKYAINPWDEGWTFGRDLRDTDAPFLKEIRDQKKVASRIFLPSFSYETLRFKYDIDKYLNLNVKKQVLFNFAAQTLRYNSNKSGRFGIYHQRDGVYLLKTAMEKNYLDPSSTGIWVRSDSGECDPAQADCHTSSKFITCADGGNTCNEEDRNYVESAIVNPDRPNVAMKRHLSVVSRLVRVIGGKIITPVEFEVKDLRVMRLRSNLFVQIDPVDEWMLWMVKLYDDLYVKAYKSKFKDALIGPAFQRERKSNIMKIIKRMKTDPRAIHNSPFVYNALKARDNRVIKNSLDENGPQELENVKYKDGKTYEVCHSPQNVSVNWNDIFKFFDIKNPVLTGRTGISDLAQFHQSRFDNSYVYEKRKKDEFMQGDAEGEKCLYVYNVIRNLLENDHSKMPLAPIDYVELANFIDEDSGLEQTTFFGPMTYLENGNSSNMRPTKNISEYVCPSADCDEVKNQHQLARDLDFAYAEYRLQPKGEQEYLRTYFAQLNKNGGHLANEPRPFEIDELDESKRYTLSDEYLSQSQKKVNSYEISRFFGSLKYANNLLIYRYQEPEDSEAYAENDLENEMYRLKDLEKKENEVRSKLFYYLNNFNLDFVSLGDEKVKFYDASASFGNGSSCAKLSQVPFKVIEEELGCFQETDMYYNKLAQETLTSDKSTVKDVKQMIQTLKITPELAGKICEVQLSKFDFTYLNKPDIKKMKFDTGKGAEAWYHMQHLRVSGRLDALKANEYEDYPRNLRFYDECVEELVQQVNIDPVKKFDIINGAVLDVERKIRVKETGRYAFKGGKALNVNVGNSVSLNHNSSYGFSESRGFGMKDIKNILLGWMPKFGNWITKWAESIFDSASGMVVGDQKWTESDTNSKSEGTSISEGTFLVMQNATLDVELENYHQCVSITFSETFLNRIGMKGLQHKKKGKVEPMLRSFARANGIKATGQDLMVNAEKYKSALSKGLLVCDDSEWNNTLKTHKTLWRNKDKTKKNYRTLPIRENFYYFTQHFTEGDMLDAGDIANHPWLKAIRGKTDMWRFLAKIRNQDMSLKGDEKTLPYAKYLEQIGIDRDYIKSKGKKLGFRTQRGNLDLGDEWPIYQLIKAYHGTVPTFPGVYSSLHSPCNYGLDFPWGDQAKDSFDPAETKMFDDYENRAEIKASIQKYHDLNFNTEDREVLLSIKKGVYKDDEAFEKNTIENLKEKYPDEAATYPELFTATTKRKVFPFEQKHGAGAMKIQNMIILEKEGDQNLDQPSKERINTCLGYSDK